MRRSRVRTTVDSDLRVRAREAHGGTTDASLIEDTPREYLRGRRSSEIDAAYERAYATPADDADAWGDLRASLDAAAATVEPTGEW